MAGYITNDEYTAAPTGVDATKLNATGTADNSQSVMLTRTIAAAGRALENYCDQSLISITRTETRRRRYTRDWLLPLNPDYDPVLTVSQVLVGLLPNQMVAVDLTNLYIENQEIIVPASGLGTMTSQGPLTIGTPRSGSQILARYTYVNGWASTTLATSCTADAATLTVTDATGILTTAYAGPNFEYKNPGHYTLYDPLAGTGDLTEPVVVTGVTGNVLTLAAPTVNAHNAGVGFSNMPEDVKQAAIQADLALIKSRGDVAQIMTQLTVPGQPIGMDKGAWTDTLAARDLLEYYRRIR